MIINLMVVKYYLCIFAILLFCITVGFLIMSILSKKKDIKYLYYARNVSFIGMILGWVSELIPNKEILLEFAIR